MPTPLMDQYHQIKRRHPHDILFFRLGDFYEMFYEDAKTAARVLGITLTGRQKGDARIPMAGVPYHAAATYINRLLRAGHRVAVCDQMEEADAAAGAVVDRAVTRVVTPGTLIDEALLEDKVNNFLVAVGVRGPARGLAWIDCSTGEFQAEDLTRGQLADELARLAPSECLVAATLAEQDAAAHAELRAALRTVVPFHDWTFDRANAVKALCEHFGTASLDGFGCGDLDLGVGAAGAILEYLHETHRATLKHVTRLAKGTRAGVCVLDRASIRSLELTESIREGDRKASLLGVLDRTQTAMGGRLLREWVLSPLCDVEAIRRRQDGVREFIENAALREACRKRLQGMTDLERLAGKIGASRATPRDLGGLRDTLAALPRLRDTLSEARAAVLREHAAALAGPAPSRVEGPAPSPVEGPAPSPVEGPAPSPVEGPQPNAPARGPNGAGPSPGTSAEKAGGLEALLVRALAADPPHLLQEGGIFRAGYHEELDRLRAVGSQGKGWIAEFEAQEVRRAGIPSLKVGFNSVFGYYIEVTNTHREKVPADYIRKQTIKNAERYITPALKEHEDRVLRAEERARKLEHELFVELRDRAARAIPDLQRAARALAALDALASLASAAQDYDYALPAVDDSGAIEVTDGRHPVVERMTAEPFVPNDLRLDAQSCRVMILTGPNMAGKSTYIRQAALMALMAQMGSAVPAKSARVGVVDRIFTRVGAADDLTRGASTFMVEMNEAAAILHNATARSLVVLDEVGRGTSTYDGLAIAWAMTEHLHERVRARTLFATHYHELTELARLLPAVKNFHVAVREWGDGVVFLHKILEGGTDKSYGLHVARLAGIPREVVERAKAILATLEEAALDELGRPRAARKGTGRAADAAQLPLFPKAGRGREATGAASPADTASTGPADDPLRRALAAIDVERLTPLQALERLAELQRIAGGKTGRPIKNQETQRKAEQ